MTESTIAPVAEHSPGAGDRQIEASPERSQAVPQLERRSDRADGSRLIVRDRIPRPTGVRASTRWFAITDEDKIRLEPPSRSPHQASDRKEAQPARTHSVRGGEPAMAGDATGRLCRVRWVQSGRPDQRASEAGHPDARCTAGRRPSLMVRSKRVVGPGPTLDRQRLRGSVDSFVHLVAPNVSLVEILISSVACGLPQKIMRLPVPRTPPTPIGTSTHEPSRIPSPSVPRKTLANERP